MPNLLVEIGTEELPSDALDVIDSVLRDRVIGLLSVNKLSHKNVFVEATPRRIAFFVEELANRQKDENLKISGPSVEKAYDSNGNPTPALQGFLKSKNGNLNEVKSEKTPKGEFVFLERKQMGKPAIVVLPDLIKAALNSPVFPKNMRWERSGFRFPRPVRWIVGLLDKKVIPLELAGIKAGNKSSGHRFLSPHAFTIPSADWNQYQKLLRKVNVILQQKERGSLIRKGLEKKFHQKNPDTELIRLTAQLVEEPFLMEGSFSKDYLQLPDEVLASCMKKNQKIFACYDAKGRLISRFVAVLNGKRKGLSKIRSGYENVLESRLKDARYFYQADTQSQLEKKLPKLEQIVYLGKLGTMLDKTSRLEKLAEKFAGCIGRNDIKEDLKRVAWLSKIDLMTKLVYEFPDLQGIVGREYALESGEKESVAQAIGSQYLPKNLSEDYRELVKQITPLGAMFGLIDRLDLLVGAFGTGLEPTGSQDPFALRRAGGSIVKMIRAFRFHFSLKEIIKANLDFYGKVLQGAAAKKIQEKIFALLKARVVFELQIEAGNRSREILEAVFLGSVDDLADVYDRFESLSELNENEPENFMKAAKVVERTSNIIKGASVTDRVNSEIFKENSEKKLFQILEEQSGKIEGLLRERNYKKATVSFGEAFYKPLNEFFEQVMVNVEDASLRSNRQALMKRINRLYTERLADLSVLSRMD